jgi:MFS family permease
VRASARGRAWPDAVWPFLPLFGLDGLMAATVGMVPPLLPVLAGEFALSPVQIGLVNTAYAVGRLAGSYPATWLRARRGTRFTVLAGFLVLIAGALGCALLPGFPFFLAGRLVMGLGACAAYLGVFAELLETAPAPWRGRLVNGFEAVAILSLAVGGVVAGTLVPLVGWRGVFLGVAAALLVGLAALRGISHEAGRHDATARGGEPRSAAPALGRLVPVHVAGLALALTWSGLFATLVPILGSERYGLDGTALGWALAAGYVAELAGLVGLGLVIDRAPREPVFLLGAVSVTCGGLLLAVAARPAVFVAALALIGGGYANWMIPATVLADRVGTPIPPGHLAAFRISLDAGMILGPILLGGIAEMLGLRAGAGVAGVLLLAGAFVLARR